MKDEPFDPNVPSKATLAGITVTVVADAADYVPHPANSARREQLPKLVGPPTKADLAGITITFDSDASQQDEEPQRSEEHDCTS